MIGPTVGPVPLSRRRFLSALALVGASGALAGCGDSSRASTPESLSGETLGASGRPVTAATIVSPDSSFDVTTIHVPVGEPVDFTYDNRHDGVPHNLHVSGNGLDALTPVRPGKIVQELTVTFPEAGRYDYICDIHPDTMRGVVIAA